MKRLLWVLIACSSVHAATPAHDFNIIVQAQWQDLENNEQRVKDFGGKWILAGSITFKKKAKDTVHLSKLYLQWQGSKIENLVASLYRKTDETKFLPIQENLICDGLWNKSDQTLILNFERKETLGPVNTYYLVLTVPETLEPTIKQGSFDVLVACLPAPFQETIHDKLSIAYGKPKLKPKFEGAIRIAKR
jgi:hypothetical protein